MRTRRSLLRDLSVSRRSLIKKAALTGLGAPVLGQFLAACSDDDDTEEPVEPDEALQSSIEPHKRKRDGVGLRGHNPERASEGYTLFTPLNNDGTTYLIDMAGDVIHSWETGYPPGLYGYLTDDGTLLYNAQTEMRDDSFLGQQPFRGGLVFEMDWDGDILWEIEHPDHHHDGIKLKNGNVMLLCLGPIPDELATQVQGGRAGTEAEGVMYADYLLEVTTDGDAVWEWRCWEHLDPAEHVIIADQDGRAEWTHGNAVAELPDGNLAVSFRSTSNVVIVERDSGEITWDLGAPDLVHQHAPTPVDDDRLLIFDNGTHRPDHHLSWSRVVEVDIGSQEIVWSYQEDNPIDFFSPLISNAQRLPNGNTLICEGSFGRFFEVTSDGDVVWEYVNPFFNPSPVLPDNAESNEVFRCHRYSEEQIEHARSTV